MVLGSQLRAGMAIAFEDQTYRVVSAEYHPGQGKMGGVTHARLQNVDTSTFRELSIRAELKLQDLPVEKHSLEFLYSDGEQCCFMDPLTFDQTEISRAVVGRHAGLLEAGVRVTAEFVKGRPVYVAFPDVMEIKVADTAPPTRQQADSTFKPARLTNGMEVMVPQFIRSGDIIRIDVGNMRYMDRARAECRAKV